MADWYKMDPVDWNEGTDQLTLEQEAAYLRICHAIYITGKPVADNKFIIAGLFRCNDRKAQRLLSELVEAGKLALENGSISNRRAIEEVSARVRLSADRKLTGSRGGIESAKSRSKPLKNNDSGEAFASTSFEADKIREEEEKEIKKENESSSSRQAATKTDRSEARKKLETEFVETFWPSYPRKVDKKDALKAFIKARSSASLDTIMDGLRRYASSMAGKDDQFIRHASRWLNAESWNNGGEVASSETVAPDWSKRLRYGRRERKWSTAKWGPLPGSPGCMVPQELIEAGDGAGWKEWEYAA